jgi:hypothetical protein
MVDCKIALFRNGIALLDLRTLAREGSMPPRPRFLRFWLVALDDFLYFNVDVIAFTNLVNELTFSAVKQAYAVGETAFSTDMKMFWRFVTTLDERMKRREYKNKLGPRAGKTSRAKDHSDTFEKKIAWLDSAIGRGGRYLDMTGSFYIPSLSLSLSPSLSLSLSLFSLSLSLSLSIWVYILYNLYRL